MFCLECLIAAVMEANVLMPKFVPAAMPAVCSILKTIGNLTTPITNPTIPTTNPIIKPDITYAKR